MKAMNKEILDRFGELLVRDVYDEAVVRSHKIITGDIGVDTLMDIHSRLKYIDDKGLSAIQDLDKESIKNTLHYFLWMIERSDEFDLVAREGKEIVSLKEISDGLCGEIHTEDGWIAKYSKYYSPPAVIVQHFEPRGPLWEYLAKNFPEFLREHNLYEDFENLGEQEAERICQAYPKELFINRCSKCNFIKKTYKASLCLNCGDSSPPLLQDQKV